MSYGGIRSSCFDAESTEPVVDCAERAELFARARPVLRLVPTVVESLGLALLLDDPEEARTALGLLASNDGWPAWRRIWAECLAKGRGSFVVPGEPAWTVIDARRVPLSTLRKVVHAQEVLEDGVELTTDGDDSFHAGRAVSLSEHSRDVETLAREYAIRCGLGPRLAEHIALAAWLHDIGKADRRFQLMLRGGSEIDYLKDETLWAKSKMPPGARAAHRLAQQKSGYPEGARHEVQSLAMLQDHLRLLKELLETDDKEPDVDLVLHLVASHHGYCRPFAPAVVDESPVEVMLDAHVSEVFGTLDISSASSNNLLHRLDSPLADRFWMLVGRYGWQELCWFEAILRLADHRASEEERNASVDA